MTSTTSLWTAAATLCLMMFGSACASFAIASLQPLEQRVLRFSADRPGLEYSYWECTKYTLGFCRHTELRTERWDLTKEEDRKLILAKGFVAMVEPKP